MIIISLLWNDIFLAIQISNCLWQISDLHFPHSLVEQIFLYEQIKLTFQNVSWVIIIFMKHPKEIPCLWSLATFFQVEALISTIKSNDSMIEIIQIMNIQTADNFLQRVFVTAECLEISRSVTIILSESSPLQCRFHAFDLIQITAWM